MNLTLARVGVATKKPNLIYGGNYHCYQHQSAATHGAVTRQLDFGKPEFRKVQYHLIAETAASTQANLAIKAPTVER